MIGMYLVVGCKQLLSLGEFRVLNIPNVPKLIGIRKTWINCKVCLGKTFESIIKYHIFLTYRKYELLYNGM